MKYVVIVFKYIEPLWLGRNGKLSIRRFLALVLSNDFVNNIKHVIHNVNQDTSFADITMLLGLEAGLIAALLALTTYSANVAAVKSIPPENCTD